MISIVNGDIVIGVVMAGDSGTWQFTPTLAKGKHSIMADASNGSGDTSLLSASLIVNM